MENGNLKCEYWEIKDIDFTDTRERRCEEEKQPSVVF